MFVRFLWGLAWRCEEDEGGGMVRNNLGYKTQSQMLGLGCGGRGGRLGEGWERGGRKCGESVEKVWRKGSEGGEGDRVSEGVIIEMRGWGWGGMGRDKERGLLSE